MISKIFLSENFVYRYFTVTLVGTSFSTRISFYGKILFLGFLKQKRKFSYKKAYIKLDLFARPLNSFWLQKNIGWWVTEILLLIKYLSRDINLKVSEETAIRVPLVTDTGTLMIYDPYCEEIRFLTGFGDYSIEFSRISIETEYHDSKYHPIGIFAIVPYFWIEHPNHRGIIKRRKVNHLISTY